MINATNVKLRYGGTLPRKEKVRSDYKKQVTDRNIKRNEELRAQPAANTSYSNALVEHLAHAAHAKALQRTEFKQNKEIEWLILNPTCFWFASFDHPDFVDILDPSHPLFQGVRGVGQH